MLFFLFSLEKLTCVNCLQENIFAFGQKINNIQGRRPLVLFLVNTVLNSKEISKQYCFCRKIMGKCLPCQFQIFYMNSEYDLYENCFDRHFLHYFHLHMCENLNKLRILDSHIVCKLLNKQYHYQHRDWFTEEKY